ncbi:MAG: glycoside hydrolase family 3 C-terminal domain-containing protein [Peptostreptococcaceae bacterium]|nr:glycoside hydrolase family 3 C-terminal domain-containing protein [Peptostreptococcaceae bacterium]
MNKEERKYNKNVAVYRDKARKIVEQMTLEEKVSQTLHKAPAIPRLGIKSYNWWNEALHGVARSGVATVFPQVIGMAASFDKEMIKKVGDVVATEGRGKFNIQQEYGDTDIYKGLTFWAPNVNIFRDPRWGRGHETYGEDPCLTSALAVNFIEAMQGDGEYMKVAACAKHFAVHSGPEDIRHSFNAEVSKQDLFETYLPAFEACVKDAHVEILMGAYNRTNGEPCCGSKTLLTDLLRNEWGFEGHVTSDCWAIKDFYATHNVVKGPVEAVALAMNNGCDLNCGSIYLCLTEAVKSGFVDEKRLDEAVENLFVTRLKLGILQQDNECEFDAIGYEQVDSPEHMLFNREVSRKTIVLLKNQNNILPLDKNEITSIGVIGPNADNRKALVGNYEGTASAYVTILEGIKSAVSSETRVYYSKGCALFGNKESGLAEDNDRLSEVKAVCSYSDVIIACMGLDPSLEGEEGDEGNEFASGDKPNIKFPGIQPEIMQVMKESGKPIILVVLSGSALALDWASENYEAILQGWYPGTQGGNALADILFGKNSPEGKLPVTFYSEHNTLPPFTDYSMKMRTYRYMREKPVYPFGYGLSYSHFELDSVVLNSKKISAEKKVMIKARLKNLGPMDAAETVQIYISCHKEGAPRYALKAFQKVYLKKGAAQDVSFTLTAKDFAFYDEEATLKLYKGVYSLYIGTQQPDERSKELTGKVPQCIAVSCDEDTTLYVPTI